MESVDNQEIPKKSQIVIDENKSPVQTVKSSKHTSIQAYALQILLVTLGLILSGSGWLYLISDNQSATSEKLKQSSQANDTSHIDTISETQSTNSAQLNKPIEMIVIDVSGAVLLPGVVYLPQGSRVADAISNAGGYASTADLTAIGRTINLSQKLNDEDKIVIPFIGEKSDSEMNDRKGETTAVRYEGEMQTPSAQTDQTLQISINKGSIEELDTLPGIGPSRAAAIVEGRPYQMLRDLVTKEVLGEAIYAQIEAFISL